MSKGCPVDYNWDKCSSKDYGYTCETCCHYKYVQTTLTEAIYEFAKGKEVQCRIGKSTWTFNYFNNNGTIVMNPHIINFGEWFVKG